MNKNRIFTFVPSIFIILGMVFLSIGCQPSLPDSQTKVMTPTVIRSDNPYELISLDSLLAYLEDLTSIQPYSGWRNSASLGEAEALDYVEGKLRDLSYLQQNGMETERQSFKVYLSTEIWTTGLTVVINGQEIEVSAEGLRASRFDQAAATYFDTDGGFNDSNPDPLTSTGFPLIVRNEEILYTLKANELKDRILFLDYSLVDRYVNDDAGINGSQLVNLVNMGLAGVVLVTEYSNESGESRGTLLGDGANFQREVPSKRVPILYVRLEDLHSAGITTWKDLEKIQSAKLVLDSDVYSPGNSGNVVARINGADSSSAVILGAHIDTPNGPGAFDDGSGSAALLEIARVLNLSQILPPVDIYLVWFGGHEIGTYGSAYFAATHQELLDQSLAMFQMDCLGEPMDGNSSSITMFLTSYGRFGDERLPISDFLTDAVTDQGITLDRYVEYGLIADNSNFDIFNVPNFDLLYLNDSVWRTKGSGYSHYANHFHDPYETVERVREVGDKFVEMTKVMLTAALETGKTQPNLRVTSAPEQRALIVGSHTESINLITAMLRELGMALAWEGFDVDMIPYGQAITTADLKNVGIVVLPPTLDYPGPHNENWSESEIALLTEYVLTGGLLLVTNTSYNYSTKIPLDENNEDSRKINTLLEPMGISFKHGKIGGDKDEIAKAVVDHPLTENSTYLTYNKIFGVPFSMESGLELIRADYKTIVGLIDYGEQGGQVLVIADMGILQADSVGAKNLEFIKNIARYARTR